MEKADTVAHRHIPFFLEALYRTMAEDGQGPGLPEVAEAKEDGDELIGGLDSLAVAAGVFDDDKKPGDADTPSKTDEGPAIVPFVPPSPTEECPLCFIPLPRRNGHVTYMACCGKRVCAACFSESARVLGKTNAKRAEKKLKPFPWLCPFCRAPLPESDEDFVQRYKKRAKKGDSQGMFNLAAAYRDGLFGLAKDLRKAVELFHRAADLGQTDAICELGGMYAFGSYGVSLDEAKGREFLERAAKKGNTIALVYLALLEDSKGRADLAVAYLRTAAEAGEDEAIRGLKKKFRAGKLSKDDLLQLLWAHHDANENVRSEARERFKRWEKVQEKKQGNA